MFYFMFGTLNALIKHRVLCQFKSLPVNTLHAITYLDVRYIFYSFSASEATINRDGLPYCSLTSLKYFWKPISYDPINIDTLFIIIIAGAIPSGIWLNTNMNNLSQVCAYSLFRSRYIVKLWERGDNCVGKCINVSRVIAFSSTFGTGTCVTF